MKLNTTQGKRVNEELLEWRKVSYRDLRLEKLHSLLEVASSNIEGSISWVESQSCLVGVSAWLRRNEDITLLSRISTRNISSGSLCGALGLKLVIEAAKTVVIFAPLCLLNVYLCFCFRLGSLCSIARAQNVVYLLICRLEIVVFEELLICLLLIEEFLALEHLFGLFNLFGPQISHGPLSEVGLAFGQMEWAARHKSFGAC